MVLGSPDGVRAVIGGGQVVFANELGTFTIPTRCLRGRHGVGYVSRWALPDGTLVSADRPAAPPSSSGYGFANDPGQGGFGVVQLYVAYGPPPWRQWDTRWSRGRIPRGTAWVTGTRRCGVPGVTAASAPRVTASTYGQTVSLAGAGARVGYRWSFAPRAVRLEVTLAFVGGARAWVKEPEVALALGRAAGIAAIETPGTGCPVWRRLRDPRRATGRCSEPARSAVRLTGSHPLTLELDDGDWRRLAADARTWPRAGGVGCMTHLGYRTEPFDNYEYVAWNRDGGALDSVSVLVKGYEGCVTSTDASSWYRRPRPGSYRLRVTVEP